MARINLIKILRTTRALLNSQAGSSGLSAGEPYLITDENRFAVALTTSTYQTFLKPGDVEVANRTALAALPATAGSTAYLAEAGREGRFVFRSSDYSALVTVDTRQGIFVAPASDTDGSSGAWVRTGWTTVECHWFGLNANDVGGSGGTDDSAAINAAHEVAEALGFTVAYGRAAPPVHLRMGEYFCSSAIVPQQGKIFYGDGAKGDAGGGATVIRFGSGVHGIDLQYATGIRSPAMELRGFHLKGAYSNFASEGEYHGLHADVRFRARDLIITNFQGDGIHIEATAEAGNSFLENVNNFVVEDCWIDTCRNNFYVTGADANAGSVIRLSTNFARRWGVYDTSFLGNYYECLHADGNGIWIDTDVPPSVVSRGGSRYSVVFGQESNASTNPPKSSTVTITIASPAVVSWTSHGLSNGTEVSFSTTAALPTGLSANTTYFVVNAGTNDFQVATSAGGAAINTSGSQSGTHTSGAGVNTAYWLYLSSGGPAVGGGLNIPTWTSSMTLRSGGSYYADGANGGCEFHCCYAETGQGWNQFGSAVLAIRGQGLYRHAGTLWADNRGLVCKNLSVDVTLTTAAANLVGPVTLGDSTAPTLYSHNLYGTVNHSGGNFNSASGNTFFGPNTGTFDHAFTIRNTNVWNELHFDTSGVTKVNLLHANGSYFNVSTVEAEIRLSPGSTQSAKVTADGIDLVSGNFFSVNGTPIVSDATYGSGWNAVVDAAPSKNSVYDKIETMQQLSLVFHLSGGGGTIAAGQKFDLPALPFACTVTQWTVTADVSGSAVVDILRATYANFPTFTSIAGTEKPTLSSQQKNQDVSLTTWTTSLAEGDVIRANVDSASTVSALTVVLRVTRT